MSAQTPIVLAFDLYGTLLSTASIAEELAKHLGQEKANAVAATWRTYQLEYTWRLNSMHKFITFSIITARSLTHALRSHATSLNPEAHASVLSAYNSLQTFPDVGPALARLAEMSPHKFKPYIFSNGSAEMVSASMNHSPSLAPYARLFSEFVTVDDVKRFKPDPAVYELLAQRVGKEGRQAEMWLVSGNPFDVVGARATGMQAAWVDREGNGWVDELLGSGVEGRPTIVARGLEDVLIKVEEWLEGKGVR